MTETGQRKRRCKRHAAAGFIANVRADNPLVCCPHRLQRFPDTARASSTSSVVSTSKPCPNRNSKLTTTCQLPCGLQPGRLVPMAALFSGCRALLLSHATSKVVSNPFQIPFKSLSNTFQIPFMPRLFHLCRPSRLFSRPSYLEEVF